MTRTATIKWLTKPQYRSFINQLSNPTDELLFRLMGDCGLRVGEVIGGKYVGIWTTKGKDHRHETELAGLCKSNFHGDEIVVYGKGGVLRVLPVPARVKVLLEACQTPMMKPLDRFVSIGYTDRKSTRLNSSHIPLSRMPSSA